MKDPVPTFIDLARVKDIDENIFLWICEEMEIEEPAETLEDLQEDMLYLQADIIKFGNKFFLRKDDGTIDIWDRDSTEGAEWDADDLRLIELLDNYPDNPLREHL